MVTAEKPALKPLTVKQDQFAFFIANGLSQEDAALKAGYSPKTARHTAHTTLAIVGVQDAVARYRSELQQSQQATPEFVMTRLVSEARSGETSSARVAALRTLADILGMTAGRSGELPAALTGMLEALGRGLASGQQPRALESRTVEILPPASPADSEQEA